MNIKLWKLLIGNIQYQLLVLGGILLCGSCGGVQSEPHVTTVLPRSPSTQPTSLPANIIDPTGSSVDVDLPTILTIAPTANSVPTIIPSSAPSVTHIPNRMTETPIPAIFEIGNELLNDISTDFLYITGGSLYLFDRQKKSNILLLAPTPENNQAEIDTHLDCASLSIDKVVIDKPNKSAAILVDKGITANGIEQFLICSKQFETGEVYKLIDNIPRPSEIHISPDGKWIDYIDTSQSRRIVLMQTEQRDSMQTLSICSGSECMGEIWSPDSKFLLWSEASGIWQLDVNRGEKEHIRPGIVEVRDQSGEQIILPVFYQPIAWSPAGRYVSVEIHPERSEVQWVALLDTKTDRMVEIPGTHSYPEDAAVHTWNNDGTLTTVRFTAEDEEERLEIITYKIVPTHLDLIITTRTKIFPIPERFTGVDQISPQSLQLYNLHQHPSGTYSLRLGTDSPDSKSWLVELDDQEQAIKVISELPSDPIDILWSSDGKNVIIPGRHGEWLIKTYSQDTIKDLQFYLGVNIQDFSWLSGDVQLRP